MSILDTFEFSLNSFRHDVADIAGISAFAFGEEEYDRYVMIFKKVSESLFIVIYEIHNCIISKKLTLVSLVLK